MCSLVNFIQAMNVVDLVPDLHNSISIDCEIDVDVVTITIFILLMPFE